MERRGKTKRFTLRLLIFFAGLVVLSLGIDLNTKTQLGISPINSVPFNVHQLTGLPLHARHGTHRKAHLRPYREALRKSLLNIETTPKEKILRRRTFIPYGSCRSFHSRGTACDRRGCYSYRSNP